MPMLPAGAGDLLREGLVRVVRRTPLAIRLTAAAGELRQIVTPEVDCGCQHAGQSVATEKADRLSWKAELRQDLSPRFSRP